MSQHSYGSAIDIASINGASVLFDWANTAEKSEFLKNAGKQPSTIFQMSLRRFTIRRIKITSILMTGISQHVKNQLILN